jgi:hypothetical protein
MLLPLSKFCRCHSHMFSRRVYCPAAVVATAAALNTVIVYVAIINNAIALALRHCLGYRCSRSNSCCHTCQRPRKAVNIPIAITLSVAVEPLPLPLPAIAVAIAIAVTFTVAIDIALAVVNAIALTLCCCHQQRHCCCCCLCHHHCHPHPSCHCS